MTYPLASTGTGAGGDTGISGGRLRMTPGRVAALVIGVPVVLAAIGWTGFNFVALLGQASFPVSYTVPVRHGQVTAQVDGNVTLRQVASTAGQAKLTGTVRYSLFRPAVTMDQTATSTNVGFRCHAPTGNCSLDSTLVVPARTAVSLSTGGGDLSVSDFSGDTTLDTQGGNLTSGTFTGNEQLTTSGGDLSVQDLTGDATLDTQGGNLSTGTLTGDLQLTTGGGDMGATALSELGASTLRLNSQGGNISVGTVTALVADVQSGGGDISLTFTKTPTSLQIHSSGGNVALVLPPGQYNFAIGAHGGNVSAPASDQSATDKILVDSGGGDISISEANPPGH